MSATPLSATAPGTGSRPWLGWLLVSVALVVTAGVAVIIDRLRERADECRRVQTELASLNADAHELAALEWETIHKEKLNEESSGRLEKIQARMNERFSRLGRLGLRLPQFEEFNEGYRAYVRLVDQEFKLIAAAKIEEAEEFDEAKVDPAFDALETAMEEMGEAYDKLAVRTLRLVSAGTLLALLCGMGVIAGLVWQFNKKRHMVEIAATGQRALRQANEDLESRVRGRTAELAALHGQLEVRVVERTGELETANQALQTEIAGRKRTEAALQERVSLTALEGDIGTALTRGGTLAEMLRLCSEAIVRHLDAAFARIWTLNEREQMLELQASAGIYTHLDGPHGRVPVGTLKIGLIASERKPHLTNQVVGDPRVGDQEWATREGMVAFAGYPLLVEDRLVGVVAMFARHQLTDLSLQALASISNNIAVCIARKRIEESLRESEERFRDLFENATDLIQIVSPDGHFVFVNRAWKQALGYTDEERSQLTVFDIVDESSKAHCADAFRRLMAGEDVPGVEAVFVGRQGQRITVEGSVTCRRVDGKPGNTRGMFRDITARKQAEQTLQRLRDQHALILNSVSEGVHGLDLDGRITFENPASAAMLGYETSDLLGQPAHGAMHHTRPDGTPYPPSECPIYATLRDGLVRHGSNEVFWRKDGTSFPVEYTSTPLHDEGGRIIGATVVFTDITARKQAQAELESLHQQLVEASRRGGMAEVATNVLHNVGNVLNSVNISTSLIVESVKQSRVSSLARVVVLLREHAHDLGAFITHDAQGQQVPAYLAQLAEHLVADQAGIASELDSLRRNVEHIKEIVAMQQSYATFGGVKEMIDVVSLVEDSLRINEGSLSRHRVAVIREFAKVPLMNVEKHKILQILVNLVRNAKYACDEAGGADKQLTLRVTDGDGRVKISVIDNGVGIPAENLTRIFNHGFTTRKDGHGFGLHSGALAAKEMGGSLTVHSDGPDKGATFTLELPLHRNGTNTDPSR